MLIRINLGQLCTMWLHESLTIQKIKNNYSLSVSKNTLKKKLMHKIKIFKKKFKVPLLPKNEANCLIRPPPHPPPPLPPIK